MTTQHSLMFGSATRDITPAYPVWLHGYSARDRMSDGVREPVTLSCLAVSNGDLRVLVVACDLIGIESWMCDDLAGLLEREVGIGYPQVIFACSHTHFAPALHWEPLDSPCVNGAEPDPRFIAAFKIALVEAARASLQSLQAGRLQTLRLPAPQVLFNRRTVCTADGLVTTNFLYPEEPAAWTFSPVDDQLTVLRVVGEAGVLAMLVNFGCHPVTGGPDRERDTYRISSEYPHYLRQTIAEKFACPVLFTLGAAGDAVPLKRNEECRQRIGSILGNTAILGERAYQTDVSPDLQVASVTIEGELALRTDRAAAERNYAAARDTARRIAEAPAADHGSPDYRAAMERFQHAAMTLHRARIYPDGKQAIRLQFLRIGTTTIVAWPFEVLAGIGLRIKQRFPDVVMISCAGGYQGYIPLAADHPRGGYEASGAAVHFVPGTGDRLLEATLRWLEQNAV
ncbi:MAG: hypothetical protein WCL16_00025 [bacterium]